MRWKIIFVEKEMIQQTWMGTPADELTRQAILAVVLAAALGLGRFPFFVSSVDSFVHVPVDIFLVWSIIDEAQQELAGAHSAVTNFPKY
jgi:hypothetical protein